MDVLQSYVNSDSDEDGEITNEPRSLLLPDSGVELAPALIGTVKPTSTVAVYDQNREVKYNPKYDELFGPEAGPSNPFKTAQQLAKKNMLTGFVEAASFNDFHFDRAMRSYDTLGYAENPTAHSSTQFVGDTKKAKAEKGVSFTSTKRRWRSRVLNCKKEMDEIVRKRKMQSKAGRKAALDEEQLLEETTTLHIKDNEDYQGRSFMQTPMYTGANLRPDYVPDRCYPPTKQAFTYKSHTKAINTIRWFPKSAHMFLSGAMDCKIKLWEVYGNRKLIRTYVGHKMPVRDVCFNNDGTEFLSSSFDNYIKLWDTETGQVKNRFHTGHRAYCLTYNPDDDKQNIFLSGMQNKKIIQWDTRTGEIEQEYDRHLGPVNSITFFDKNRRFCSTSDDKSIRIWEWGIPVDTKLIQNAGMHSIPVMVKAPSEKWIIGQSMDSKIVLFQLVDDKLRFARRKNFRGHNVAGYACSPSFSPEMSFLASGDSEGKNAQNCISVESSRKRLYFRSLASTRIVAFNLCRIYVQPIPHPLQVGPDFSFLDGRKPRITNYPEFKRREEQVELGAQIVKCLKEVNEAERMYSERKREQEKESRYRETWTLSQKGNSQFS
ncbi:39S ribosomal protein L52, mitochondrial [Aphelenchoides besseyi]|nr:39S ribosomal protein L52, mitochondrial [Aphelenchoides besseyi]